MYHLGLRPACALPTWIPIGALVRGKWIAPRNALALWVPLAAFLNRVGDWSIVPTNAFATWIPAGAFVCGCCDRIRCCLVGSRGLRIVWLRPIRLARGGVWCGLRRHDDTAQTLAKTRRHE